MTPCHVLVIDDEAPIRSIVRKMLDPEICRVLEAPDAETGLRLIEQDDPQIDIVLTDWIMPGLHGLDVVEVLDRYRPDLPIVVISAFTSSIHPIVRRGSKFKIVPKPFTRLELQATVRIGPPWMCRRERGVPVRRSHTCSVPS